MFLLEGEGVLGLRSGRGRGVWMVLRMRFWRVLRRWRARSLVLGVLGRRVVEERMWIVRRR